jgi:hypothetical protein
MGGSASAQDTFSCFAGDRAACLSNGDTVCDLTGKCVSKQAECFEPYQCGFSGFVCKNDYDDAIDDYNALVRDYNDLLAYTESLEACLAESSSLEQLRACL